MAFLFACLFSMLGLSKEPVEVPVPSPYEAVELEEINPSPNPTPETHDSKDFQGTLKKNGIQKEKPMKKGEIPESTDKSN